MGPSSLLGALLLIGPVADPDDWEPPRSSVPTGAVPARGPAPVVPTTPAPARDDEVPAPARDDEVPAPAIPPAQAHRRWGLGSQIIGGGYAGTRLFGDLEFGERVIPVSLRGGGPALLLPTLEVRAFRLNGHSIDLSLPIVNLLVTSISLRGFFLTLDGFYSFNPGQKNVRAIVGPGLGVAAGGSNGLFDINVRLLAELGVEVLNRSNKFGFIAVARPWFQAGRVSLEGDALGAIGGGVLVSVGVMGYRLGF